MKPIRFFSVLGVCLSLGCQGATGAAAAASAAATAATVSLSANGLFELVKSVNRSQSAIDTLGGKSFSAIFEENLRSLPLGAVSFGGAQSIDIRAMYLAAEPQVQQLDEKYATLRDYWQAVGTMPQAATVTLADVQSGLNSINRSLGNRTSLDLVTGGDIAHANSLHIGSEPGIQTTPAGKACQVTDWAERESCIRNQGQMPLTGDQIQALFKDASKSQQLAAYNAASDLCAFRSVDNGGNPIYTDKCRYSNPNGKWPSLAPLP